MESRLKKQLRPAVVALCFTVFAAGSSYASPWGQDMGDNGHHTGHHGKEGHGGMSHWGKGGMDSDGHMTARLRMVWNLDLSQEQRAKIRKLQRELRAKVWQIEDKIEDISDELMGLYRKETRDAKKIGEVYGKIFDLRRQKIEAMIESGNAVEAVLTKDQKKQLKKMRFDTKWGSGWGSDWK